MADIAQPPRDPRDHDTALEDGGTEGNTNVPSSASAVPDAAQSSADAEVKPKEPSRLAKMWKKLALDLPTVMMMFKGSLPPIIGIAWYQSTDIAEIYITLGYLVPILSILSMCILPRAKFLQTLLLNVIGVCIAASISMLGIWSAVRARKHTTPVGHVALYNSSQSAVCAIWLFVNIWFANGFRAKYPALQFPAIIYSIFTNVAFTFGPIFQTTKQGETIIRQLIIAFLSAFAIAAAVNLFVIPITSRTVVFKEQAGYIMSVRGALKAQTLYLRSLETSDMFTGSDENAVQESEQGEKKKHAQAGHTQSPEAIALKGAISTISTLHGKLHGDLVFAKREVAWGKLDAKDLDQIFGLFRGIIIPLIGMSTIADIFDRIAERRGWLKPHNPNKDQYEPWELIAEEERISSRKTWNEIMKILHEPFSVAVAAMDEGLEHAGLVLELLPRPKAKKEDVEEAKSTNPRPGNSKFTEYMEQKMLDFYSKRGETLRAWAREKGLSADQFNAGIGSSPEDLGLSQDQTQHQQDQQQLYLILYMEHLLYSTGKAITALVRFADKKIEDGTMKKNRMIFPGKKTLKKWILGTKAGDASIDTGSPDSMEAGTTNVDLGAGFNAKKDPEHLPPQTAWQHFGNGLRTIPKVLSSTECAFGFRVACATLTIGIVAFLESTQLFFQQQRLVWAMIIIAIGMTMTAGQSIFGFFGRVAGTAVAMVVSLVIWFIVDEKTPGIIVLLWLFIFLEMYFFLKFPRFLPVWLVAIITQVLIIGYELQVRKIGILVSAQTGQPYYPIYELAPYRLACVAGGSFVAFIWTVFPFPLSDRSWLRRDLGSTLYLLANYYSVVHSTIVARMNDTEGDMATKTSPGRQLQKARHKIFSKLMIILPSLKQHADWQRWELNIGGKFPRETYEGIMLRSSNITNYLSLMSFATTSWTADDGAEYPNTDRAARRKWLDDLGALVDNVSPTSHQITSILSLLSASVKQGSALPPYTQTPEPFNLSHRLEALDKGILDARHVEEPGYSAYAVVHVASSLVIDDLAKLVEHVKDLVGETDFSFRVSTGADSPSATGRNAAKGKAD